MKDLVIIKILLTYARSLLRHVVAAIMQTVILICLWSPAVFAQVGVHTDFPDASSALEIYATNKGLLIPRVTLTSSLSNPSPVTSPTLGLLVFNTGSNQPVGFYYWGGSAWVAIGGGSSSGGDYWSLTGNAGTTVGTNFIGTLDDEDFALYTNESERMRITEAGNVVIGATAPYFPTDLFTVIGKPGLDYAISAYSPNIGVYAEASGRGFQSLGGRYGLRAELDSATGFAVYARNFDPAGYGLVTAGSNIAPSYYGGRSAGISSLGNDGIHAYGSSTSSGIGIMAAGNGLTPVVLPGGFGGTFVGNVGAYGRSSNSGANGTGIIGAGNNLTSSYYLPTGSGGAFTGRDGVFAKSINASGNGIIGVGNNISTPSTISTGTGGSFTGNDGVYAKGINTSTGIGVIGLGSNNSTYPSVSGGSGGSFSGDHGIVVLGTSAASGTGVIGAGNNNAYNVLSTGSGGAFTGIGAGVAGWGTNTATGIGVIGVGNNVVPWLPSNGAGGAFIGIDGVYGNGLAETGTGVIGAGNNVTPVLYAGGSGGAFTGTVCGVYGYATNTSGDHYGAYFATDGNSNQVGYAYVGGRFSNTRCKIIGVGTVNTIVKNTRGDLVALTCPEAPDAVFQDYGIGLLVDGKTHITIDPDLAININVSEEHPLKVYITPEGDCNGVYVTNKSANGFDVIELQGGKSNITFSWQIVATRANEESVLKDGTVEISDYSQRFPPAPGPLETIEQPFQAAQIKSIKTVEGEKGAPENEKAKIIEIKTGVINEATEAPMIEITDDPDE